MGILRTGHTQEHCLSSKPMWQKLKNLLISCQTYNDLSPDLGLRRKVNQALLKRPALSSDDWFEAFFQSRGIEKAIVEFVYIALAKYSGLDLQRVRPSDRLDEDLQLSLICWFDWSLQFCEDFYKNFGIDVRLDLDLSALTTIEELILFLHHQQHSLSDHQ